MQMQDKKQNKAEITYLEAKKKKKKHTKKVPSNISRFRSKRKNTIDGFNAIVQYEK